jgi:hypothetical protein
VYEDTREIPGLVPVFPLADVVLFPHAILPLHIFEPRYRTMIADALSGEQVVAIALLQPGFEPLYHTLRAPIHRTIGVGRIVAAEELDQGRHNILLRGVTRARVIEELPGRPYRLARVEPLAADGPEDPHAEQLQRSLREVVQAHRGGPELRDYWQSLLDASLSLTDLTDLISAGLPVEAELRQCLLDEQQPAQRARMILDHLRTLSEVAARRRSYSLDAPWAMN